MNVINFLKANSLNQLKSEYSLRVKQYPDQSLMILNYVPGSSNSPITNECRSLILSTDYKLISRSFDQFFNYNEKFCDSPNNAECYAFEKIDGSLIKIYNYNDLWYISTRGTAFAECNVTNGSTTYKEAVFEALDIINSDNAIDEQAEKRFQQFCQDCNMNVEYTYIFELTGKNNPIITVYNPLKYELWLLGIRHNNFDGKYIDVNSVNFPDIIRRPKEFIFKNIEQCIERAKSLENLQEGFVIYNQKTFEPMLKIKSPNYVHAHSFGSSGCITNKDMLRLIVNGEWTEFLAYCPHQKEKIYSLIKTIDEYFNNAQIEYEELCKNIILEADFQVFAKKPWKQLAFLTFKKKHENLREAFIDWDENKQVKFLLKEAIGNE